MRALAPLLLLACTSSGVCGPETCSGCCDANHICVGGGTDFACGSGGAACLACKPGFKCVAQLCKQGAGGGGANVSGSGGGSAGGGGPGQGGGFALGGGSGGGGGVVIKDDLDGGSCDTLETASAYLQVVLASCPASGDPMLWAFNRRGCDQALGCSSSDLEALHEAALCEGGIVPCNGPSDRMQVLSNISNCQSLASGVNPLCLNQIHSQ